MSEEIRGFRLGDKAYENAKFLVTIVLPALGVLYATLATIWGFPYAEKVVLSINAFALFLGVVLRISSSNFYKGQELNKTPDGAIVLIEEKDEEGNLTGKKTVSLELEHDPADFVGRDIIFRVKSDDL